MLTAGAADGSTYLFLFVFLFHWLLSCLFFFLPFLILQWAARNGSISSADCFFFAVVRQSAATDAKERVVDGGVSEWIVAVIVVGLASLIFVIAFGTTVVSVVFCPPPLFP